MLTWHADVAGAGTPDSPGAGDATSQAAWGWAVGVPSGAGAAHAGPENPRHGHAGSAGETGEWGSGFRVQET